MPTASWIPQSGSAGCTTRRNSGKKWGVKTGEVELAGVRDSHLEEAGGKMWSVDVMDAMKESVKEGQVMFMSESWRPKRGGQGDIRAS